MTWSHRAWEQTPRSMVPQNDELVHVCLSKINWCDQLELCCPRFFQLHHFTSFYIILPHFLEINALNPRGGAAPLPPIRHKTRFSERKKLAPKDARGKAVERQWVPGYGHFWCGWVFRCYTTSLIWACKFVKQRLGLGNVKLIFRSYFRVYWHNQRWNVMM